MAPIYPSNFQTFCTQQLEWFYKMSQVMMLLSLKSSMDSYLIRVNAKVLTRFYMALHDLALATTHLSTSSSPSCSLRTHLRHSHYS